MRKPRILEQSLALLHQLEKFSAARNRVYQCVCVVAGNDFVRRAKVPQDFAGNEPVPLSVRMNAEIGRASCRERV